LKFFSDNFRIGPIIETIPANNAKVIMPLSFERVFSFARAELDKASKPITYKIVIMLRIFTISDTSEETLELTKATWNEIAAMIEYPTAMNELIFAKPKGDLFMI
jgi:hypothetical protein